MNAHGLFFITNFLLYLPDILPKKLGGESDATYLSFSFSLN